MPQQLLQENCNFELQSKDGAKIPTNYLLFRLLTTFDTLFIINKKHRRTCGKNIKKTEGRKWSAVANDFISTLK